jgi:lysophospholipase L1-like esterase
VPHDYYILVLGDSVPWGQGLLGPQKMHELVRDAVAAQKGPTRCLQMAHSGAVIGVDSGGGPAAACAGEVPTSFPTILAQCDAGPDTDVDLVILNGGINDIDIRYILNPFTERDDLADVTRRFCGTDMSTLIDRALGRFPTAKIVVTSYYPVLSHASHFPLINDFMLTLGLPVAPLTRFLDENLIFDRIVKNAALFYETSTSALQGAVDAANAAAPGRVAFAAPAFTDDNAALAPDPWLFGIKGDLSPEDPVAAARRASCNTCLDDFLRREQCYRASAGHPNTIGARKFADAILAALGY